jgi:hypothetical protein
VLGCITWCMGVATQLEEAAAEAEYVVRWVVNVDHPEKRDETYKARTKETAGPPREHKAQHAEKAQALAHAKRLIGGDEDFASEFTSKVEVYQKLANGRTRQIMKTVERERGDDGKIRTR